MIIHTDQMVPPAVTDAWPDMVPSHGLSIVTGLCPDGSERLMVACSTHTPPWVLLGLLEAAIMQVTDYIDAIPDS